MDWTAFAERMGSLRSDGSEHCNSLLAYAALEQLVGILLQPDLTSQGDEAYLAEYLKARDDDGAFVLGDG